MILPAGLLDKVSQKMQMYIMRSKVQLHDVTDELCLIGINAQTADILPSMPNTAFAVTQNKQIFIKFPLPSNRYLIIASPSQAISLWTDLTKTGFAPGHSNAWTEQNISAGIPWLTLETSEQYIPQMLNIDKLGGISFNKGCYTGQEIIARTHYLGKAKRELFLASCNNTAKIDSQTQIITNNNGQTVGKILSLVESKQLIKMLIVMPSTDAELNDLMLNNSDQDKISIIDFR
jgi:folate-binding protein YgfZ